MRQKAGNSGKTKRAAGANGHRGAGPWLDLALCNPLMKLDPLGWPAGPGNPLPPPGLPLIYVLVSGRVAEVLPKPLFNKLNDEAEFYEAFFETIEKWASNFQDIVKDAYKYAVRHGLSALDALHVASALTVGADEFVTGEKPTKPINSVSALKIHSIHSE